MIWIISLTMLKVFSNFLWFKTSKWKAISFVIRQEGFVQSRWNFGISEDLKITNFTFSYFDDFERIKNQNKESNRCILFRNDMSITLYFSIQYLKSENRIIWLQRIVFMKITTKSLAMAMLRLIWTIFLT